MDRTFNIGYKFRPIRSGTTHGTSGLPHELVTSRETRIKLYLSLLALAGTLVFLMVFLMDREREAGIFAPFTGGVYAVCTGPSFHFRAT